MLNYSVLSCKSYNTYKVRQTGSGWTCLQLGCAPSVFKSVNWPIKQAAWQHRTVSIHIWASKRMRDDIASTFWERCLWVSRITAFTPLGSSPSSTLLQVNTFIRCHLLSTAVILTLTLQNKTTKYWYNRILKEKIRTKKIIITSTPCA